MIDFSRQEVIDVLSELSEIDRKISELAFRRSELIKELSLLHTQLRNHEISESNADEVSSVKSETPTSSATPQVEESETILPFLMNLINRGYRTEVKQALQKYGVKNLNDVSDEIKNKIVAELKETCQ